MVIMIVSSAVSAIGMIVVAFLTIFMVFYTKKYHKEIIFSRKRDFLRELIERAEFWRPALSTSMSYKPPGGSDTISLDIKDHIYYEILKKLDTIPIGSILNEVVAEVDRHANEVENILKNKDADANNNTVK